MYSPSIYFVLGIIVIRRQFKAFRRMWWEYASAMSLSVRD